MLVVPEELREQLKRPLGKLMQMDEFVSEYGKKKIISVGDIVTASLLELGVMPFLAVYDFKTMRNELGVREKNIIEKTYPKPDCAKNPAGEISDELEKKASSVLKKGGALFVKGEEDLATLVFMRISPEGCVILYGQPKEGVVAVECDEKSRKKADEFLRKMRKKD